MPISNAVPVISFDYILERMEPALTVDIPNIRHMRVLREAVETGSVSTAAERCQLSQPAATQAIARLEDAFGTPLLVRTSRGTAPSAAGTLLAARIGTALEHLRVGAQAALRAETTAPRRPRQTFDRHVTAAQLKTLVAIANNGSFTLAARALGVSQPTVHRTARNLEELAGIAFFRATASGVELTPAAQFFALGVKLARAEIRQAVEEIGALLGDDRGTFTLGMLPLARTSLVARAADALISATRRVQIRVTDGRYAHLLRSLREGDIDCLIGALRQPAPADDVTEEFLFEDELAIVVHARHPLATRSSVDLAETLAFPWIAPPRDTPPGTYLFETLRIHERKTTPVRLVFAAPALMQEMLATGNYISIVSRRKGSAETAGLVSLPIPLTDNRRAYGLTCRTGWRPTDTQRRFIDLLRRHSAD